MEDDDVALVALVIEAILIGCVAVLVTVWCSTGRPPQIELSQGLWVTYIPVLQPYLCLWLSFL